MANQAFFHRSTSGAPVLISKAELLQLPKHKLVQDVCTRWNSAADMVERYLEMQPPKSATVTSKEMRDTLKDLDTLSDKDTPNAHEVLECLLPLRTVTTALCTEKTPTFSIIVPVLQSLMGLTAADTDIPMVKEMKHAIVADLSKRYTSKRDFLLAATVMDPRFTSICCLQHYSDRRIKPDARCPEYTAAVSDKQCDVIEPALKKVKLDTDHGLAAILGDVFLVKVDKIEKSTLMRANDETQIYLKNQQFH